ncbi:RHS Repeat protein [compost metagenome]
MLQPGLYQFTHNVGNSVNYKVGLSDVSFTFYDQLGRVRATIPPEGVKKLWTEGVASYATLASIPFVETFKYDGRGRLIESVDADAGKAEMKYSSDGKLRYSQNALQKLSNKFSYTNYDRYGRNVESGELAPSGAVNFGNLTAAMLDATEEDPSKYPSGTKYDVTVVTYDTASVVPSLVNYVQDSYFLSGSAVATKAKYSGAVTPANLVSKTWYNYDGDGNVVWTVKYVAGLGYKTMEYSYDDIGNVTKSIYQKGTAGETMVHYFEYDKNKRLVAAYTNTTDNAGTKVLHAKYSYYLHGDLKRVELGDKLQGIDYVYGIDGKLKSINNANASKDPGRDGGNGFAADVFGMNLEYHSGDYSNRQAGISSIQAGSSTANYSGLINGMSWFSRKPNSTDVGAVMNIYSYDAVGQLAANRWGTPNFNGSAFVSGGEINREHGLSYDGHGNIKSLIRTGTGTTVLGNYTYNYQANTNKLTSVSNYASYTYDAIGQLASQVKGNVGMYLDYDVTGKVTKIYSDNTKKIIILSFVYDDEGNRVMKKDHRTNAVTWYSYDGSGALAALFEQQGAGAVQLKEQPVYGSDRLGTFYRLGSNYQYTITDHVGNTRVVINRNKTADNAADIVYYADYYPFGMEVRSGGIENRYGYQGLYAEKDKETGWNNFELRNYDAAIGRWLTTDPYGQYHSPYVGMGNNPVNRIDKDGGVDDIINISKENGRFIGVTPAEGNDIIRIVNEDGSTFKQFLFGKNGSFKKSLKGLENFAGEFAEKNAGYGIKFASFSDANKFYNAVVQSDREFGIFRAESDNSKNNYTMVLTTFAASSLELPTIMKNRLSSDITMKITMYAHSHPANTPVPSGFDIKTKLPNRSPDNDRVSHGNLKSRFGNRIPDKAQLTVPNNTTKKISYDEKRVY